jgi:hypothetical protein
VTDYDAMSSKLVEYFERAAEENPSYLADLAVARMWSGAVQGTLDVLPSDVLGRAETDCSDGTGAVELVMHIRDWAG